MNTQGQDKKKSKKQMKAGKLAKSKTIARVVRNTRKKGKKQVNVALAQLLKPTENDILKLLAANSHIGRKSSHVNMKRYIWKRRQDGIHVINLQKTWAKLVLAARIIVSVENPTEIMVMSSRTYGQRGAIKFARFTGSTPQAGKWVPGTLTNPQNKAYAEPRLIIVDDPITTFAALRETSYIGIPVIAFCNTDNNTRFVDCAIPCNNRGRHSVGLMFWLLAREVLRMRGQIARTVDWDQGQTCVDLFFYRDPNEIAKAKKEKEQRERDAQQDQNAQYGGFDQDAPYPDQLQYGGDDYQNNSWMEAPPVQYDQWGDANADTGVVQEAVEEQQQPQQPPAQAQNFDNYYVDQQQQQQPQHQLQPQQPPQPQQPQQPQDHDATYGTMQNW